MNPFSGFDLTLFLLKPVRTLSCDIYQVADLGDRLLYWKKGYYIACGVA